VGLRLIWLRLLKGFWRRWGCRIQGVLVKLRGLTEGLFRGIIYGLNRNKK
jgi:hypothetical protein